MTSNSNIICTYSNERESIAWFDASGESLQFIGYGSTAPESTLGFDQTDAPWFVSGVGLTNKEALNT
jgi:hypothetical protein